MSDTIRTDVAIVGGGLGGLSAARHLQEQGLDVVVLEHHTKPGGYAHYFKGSGYRFEVALHALDGLDVNGWARPMFETLGIMDEIEFNRLDPFYVAAFPDFEVAVPSEIPEYARRFADVFPDEIDGFRDLFAAIGRVGHDVGRMTRDRAEGKPMPQMEMPQHYPDMAQAFSQPWGDFVGKYLHSDEAKALVSTLWGYLGLPPSKLSAGQFALTLLSYHTAGAWYPTGGSGTMTFAIKDRVEDAGGLVLLRNTVTSITPSDGGIEVVTDRGIVVRARAVVSNASPRATARLLPDDVAPREWLTEVDGETPALSTLTVHVGVARDLSAEGWPHHEYFDMVGYDIEAEYEAILRGDFANAGMIISNYSATDPTCAPDGKSVIVLTVLAPWDHADVWGTGGDLDGYQDNPKYTAVKEEAGRVLLDRAERKIPGLLDAAEIVKIGTPLTANRYMMQPGGSIYGREQTVMNMLNRRRPTTPVPNLFLTGAWVSGGGMTVAVGSGRSTAKAVSRYLETV